MIDHLAQVVDLATESAQHGGGPFAARIVTPDGQTYDGINLVTRSSDPTAHAEVMAIRAAADALDTHDLTGAVLYTSTYPCPMCFTAAMWARLDRVVYAATPVDAAAAGFDDRVFWDVVRSPGSGVMLLERENVEKRNAPFKAWEANPDRVPY